MIQTTLNTEMLTRKTSKRKGEAQFGGRVKLGSVVAKKKLKSRRI